MDRIHTHLLERLAAPHTLSAAWQAVRRGGGMPGPDGEGIAQFDARAEDALAELRRELLHQTWQPGPAQRLVRRQDPERPLVVPSVRDRVVQRALADLLGPPIERLLDDSAHAYRPGRSPHTAVAALQQGLADGFTHVARGDVRKFFDRIDRGRLLAQVSKVTADTRVLDVIRRLLQAGVLDGVRIVEEELGIAQGSPLSPLLSNLHLAEFDRQMAADPDTVYVRYSDDFCVLTTGAEAARAALGRAEERLAQLGLALREDKCRVQAVQDGFEFVGFALGHGDARPPLRALDRLCERLQRGDERDAQLAWMGFAAFYGPPSQWGELVVERLAERGDLRSSVLAQRLAGTLPVAASTPSSDSQFRDAERKAAVRFGALMDDELAAHMVTCFGGDERQHAVLRLDDRGQRRFVSRAGPLTPELVRRHASGKEVLGSYCFRVDGLVRWLCLDVDVTRAAAEAEPEARQQALLRAHDDAQALADALDKLGAHPLVEDSGSKGRHVWVRLERPMPAREVLALAFAAESTVGEPPEGVRREHFPDRHAVKAGQAGPLVKLPWGIHPKSGRRCVFVDADGDPLPDQRAVLLSWQATPAAVVEAAAAATLVPVESDHTASAASNQAVDLTELPLTARIVQGCAVLGHLVAKVEATHYLDHSERVLLLMALGHVGTEGKRAIHTIIGLTSNYHRDKTERYINTLAPSPVSCGKIRERYPVITRLVPCDCQFRLSQGAYPTPLLHAVKPSQAASLFAGRGVPKSAGKVVPASQTQLAASASAPALSAAAAPTVPVAVPAAEPSQPAPVAVTAALGPPAEAVHPVLAVVQEWTAARKRLASADAALHALFADADRVPCPMGMLVRESGPDGWRYRIEVGELP